MNHTSKTRPIYHGVPQGSLPAPILFNISLNDLWFQLTLSLHAYAVDTTLYAYHKDLTTLEKTINTDLFKIETWCDSNQIAINSSKAQFLLIWKSRPSSDPLCLGKRLISQITSTKLLGYTLDDSLSWKSHIRANTDRISRNLNLFYLTRHLLDINTSIQFYFALIHPKL